MQSLIFSIDDRLANAGDVVPFSGHLDETSYDLGGHHFELPSGIDYDLVVTNAGEGVLVSGILKAPVVGVCDRCLEPASFDVAGEVDEYYLFEGPVDEEGSGDDEEDGVDFSLVGEDDTIDLTDALTSALIMETPFVVLCREDCLGLCPTCGANLNEGDCGCAAKREAERASESPFAALKNLDLGEEANPLDSSEEPGA